MHVEIAFLGGMALLKEQPPKQSVSKGTTTTDGSPQMTRPPAPPEVKPPKNEEGSWGLEPN
jgi:hypothetical protein